MKLINGKVTSTKPISLQKAAKHLLKFLYSSDAALGPLSAYLVSASNSLNVLVQTHEQLKGCWKPSQSRHVETQVEDDNFEEEKLLKLQEQEHQEKLVKDVEDKENRRHKKRKRLEEGIEDEKLIKGEQNSKLNPVENAIENRKQKNGKKSIGSEKLVTNENIVADIEEGRVENVKSKKKSHGSESIEAIKPVRVEGKLEDVKKLESLDDGERRVDVKAKKSEVLENLETKEVRRKEKKKRKCMDIENGEVIHYGGQRDLDKLESVKKLEYFEDDGRKVDLKEKRSEGLENLGTQQKKTKEKKKRKDSEI